MTINAGYIVVRNTDKIPTIIKHVFKEEDNRDFKQ